MLCGTGQTVAQSVNTLPCYKQTRTRKKNPTAHGHRLTASTMNCCEIVQGHPWDDCSTSQKGVDSESVTTKHSNNHCVTSIA